MLLHAFDDHRNVGQTPRPFLPLRQRAARRVDDVHSAIPQGLDVLRDGRMLQHRPVHRRRDLDLAAMRNRVGRQSVVSDADCHLRDEIGGRGRDQQQLRPARELDVIDRPGFGIAPLLDDHPVPGDGRQRQRRHESRGVGCEDDAHIGTGVFQTAH